MRDNPNELVLCRENTILAWRIPGTGEPGGLPSMGSHRFGHDWSDLAAAAAFFNTIIKVKKPVILREISYSKFGVDDMQDKHYSMMWHQKVKKSTPYPPPNKNLQL